MTIQSNLSTGRVPNLYSGEWTMDSSAVLVVHCPLKTSQMSRLSEIDL